MKAVTHNGRFHADDVFSAALLRMIFPKEVITFIRTRDSELIAKADFVFDVGGVYDGKTRFDHHQPNSPVREDGCPYAAFGLLLKFWAEKEPDKAEAIQALDKGMGRTIDSEDNGYGPTSPNLSIGRAVTFFNPTWEEDTEDSSDIQDDQAFEMAVFIGQKILQEAFQNAASAVKSKSIVTEACKKMVDGVVELPCEMPWQSVVLREAPVAAFVVYKNKEQWRATAVPVAAGSFEFKIGFPVAWRSKAGEELEKLSGIPDAIFCHKVGFMAAAKSRDGIYEMVRKAKTEEERTN